MHRYFRRCASCTSNLEICVNPMLSATSTRVTDMRQGRKGYYIRAKRNGNSFAAVAARANCSYAYLSAAVPPRNHAATRLHSHINYGNLYSGRDNTFIQPRSRFPRQNFNFLPSSQSGRWHTSLNETPPPFPVTVYSSKLADFANLSGHHPS